jgi:inner membrane protein
MDNLTHSMVGAVMGQMGLKRRTGLAMPALIIGANIPDIDAACFFWLDGAQHLGFRRGITHGPPALILLPIILTGLLLLYHRWRPNPERLPVRTGSLLAMAYIGTLSHPAMDWLNSYGIRLLEPFSSQWFYGDSVFIIDLWLWIALIGGFWWSRRREKRAVPGWKTPAIAAFAFSCLYIFGNGLITGHAERFFRENIEARTGAIPTLVVANPVPLQFWKREIQWRNDQVFSGGWYDLFGEPYFRGKLLPHNMGDPRVAQARAVNKDAAAFLFWARMPQAQIIDDALVLTDQRFGGLATANFIVQVPLAELAKP